MIIHSLDRYLKDFNCLNLFWSWSPSSLSALKVIVDPPGTSEELVDVGIGNCSLRGILVPASLSVSVKLRQRCI